MVDYIVCQKKRNSPRLNVRVCQEKCPFRDECKEYLNYLKISVKQKEIPLTDEGGSALSARP
jgi:hypothetical protein